MQWRRRQALEKTLGDGVRTGEDSRRNLRQKAGKQRQRKKAANIRRRQGKDTPATPSSFPYSSACPPRRWVSPADPIAFFLLRFGVSGFSLAMVGLPHCDARSEQGGNKAVTSSSKASSVSAIEQLKTSTSNRKFPSPISHLCVHLLPMNLLLKKSSIVLEQLVRCRFGPEMK
ncbi:hypothetical protein Taro_050707 [Colocasia esculenta]|uniref:Uncharacterized protein n=1 Tax=Colocasia esculenta TaxID=4460 RepID=A0A843XE39_COLES|nr:hypothetical protein [Colocasia esculenta]